ncbi:hypothetical protein [Rhizobium tubonense]|nr:hypothetical protein [Rhizobium tubonense]
MISERGLSVAIGQSRLKDCSTGRPFCAEGRRWGTLGAVNAAGGYCYSACPLILAGGSRRMLSPYADVGVHQLTYIQTHVRIEYQTAYKTINGKRRAADRWEVGRKVLSEHKDTKMTDATKATLLSYFKEMGVDSSIFDMLMSATPDTFRMISQAQALKIGLVTDSNSADDLIAAGNCPIGQPLSICHAPASDFPSAMGANPFQGISPSATGWKSDLITPVTGR